MKSPVHPSGGESTEILGPESFSSTFPFAAANFDYYFCNNLLRPLTFVRHFNQQHILIPLDFLFD